LHAELLHPNRGYANHKSRSKLSDSTDPTSAAQWLFAGRCAQPALGWPPSALLSV
jgi:hypothetical protein